MVVVVKRGVCQLPRMSRRPGSQARLLLVVRASHPGHRLLQHTHDTGTWTVSQTDRSLMATCLIHRASLERRWRICHRRPVLMWHRPVCAMPQPPWPQQQRLRHHQLFGLVTQGRRSAHPLQLPRCPRSSRSLRRHRWLQPRVSIRGRCSSHVPCPVCLHLHLHLHLRLRRVISSGSRRASRRSTWLRMTTCRWLEAAMACSPQREQLQPRQP